MLKMSRNSCFSRIDAASGHRNYFLFSVTVPGFLGAPYEMELRFLII